MKARDLAALAALGIAGKYAYDKFGGKGEAKKDNYDREGDNRYSSPVVEDSESNTRMNMRDMNEGYGRRDAGGNTEDVDRRAGVPERMRDMNEGYGRRDAGGNTMDVDRRASAPERAAAAAQSGDGGAAARSLLKKKSSGPAAPVVEAAPKTRAFTPPGAQDSMGAFTNAGQADAAAPGTRAFTPPGYVASANAYNQARTTDTPSNAALGDYARAINPAMHADRMLAASHPSARITDKLAVDSRTNQAAYLAKKRAEQAQMDALRSSGGRRAKGGVVKMASGGMTSSRMPKPSGASRGDGIAQRGRTRGTLR